MPSGFPAQTNMIALAQLALEIGDRKDRIEPHPHSEAPF